MSEEPKANKKSRFPYSYIIIGIIVVGIVFTAGGFTFAATQEEHDNFCSSCHTQPESTYYERSIAAQATDLASFHTTQSVRCIDCHSGEGVSGRISAELMGAHNALMWYTGTAQQPAVQTVPISDANCMKCHSDVVNRGFTPTEQIVIPAEQRRGREESGQRNHWHYFLGRWQAASDTAANCTSCHGGHATDGTAESGFMVAQAVQQQCEACHQVLRGRER